jgi:hypothetical protein
MGPRCWKCGTADNIERHHARGRHHDPTYVVPFCREHHAEVHRALENAGVDLRFTSDHKERLRRSWMAFIILQWYLVESDSWLFRAGAVFEVNWNAELQT